MDDDVQPGPTEVPEYIPLPMQKSVKAPVYTPTPCDRLVKVPISGVGPADDNMFDPMLGEWPVDDLSNAEEMTQNKKANPFTLVRKPIPKMKPSGEKPYGLRPRDRPVEVPELKGRQVDGWEYEPLNNERPANSGAKDEKFEEGPVDHPKPGTRPVGEGTTFRKTAG